MALHTFSFERVDVDTEQLEAELLAAGLPVVCVWIDSGALKVNVDTYPEVHSRRRCQLKLAEKVAAHIPGVPQEQGGTPGPRGPEGPPGRGVQVFEQTNEPTGAAEGDIWIIP